MLAIGYKYYFFGSEDSVDTDVLLVHEKATGTEDDKWLINEIKNQHTEIKDWNINIVNIENGYVIKSIPSKGSIDSVNNSLFYTYDFHEQRYPLPIKSPVERNFPLAAVKCIRAILTSFKNTSYDTFYKEQIRRTLRSGNFSEWLQLLKKIDFSTPFYDDQIKNLNTYKSLAFRIGQTISLRDGVEIYTKQDLKLNHPALSSIIDRQSIAVREILNAKVLELYELISVLPIHTVDTKVIEFEGALVDIAKEEVIK